MNRHAYCIIAHNEIEILKVLVSLIDDPRNDIFVFVDKHVMVTPFKAISLKYSKCFFMENRHKIYWGGISLTNAEIKILEFAYQKGKYSYYHLISGVDLPIKSQDYIHNLFDVQNDKMEYIGISGGKSKELFLIPRTSYYYPFQKYINPEKSRKFGRVIAHMQQKMLKFQHKFHVKRSYSMDLKMGPNWFSVTSDFVDYILSHKKILLKEFGNVCISDEIAIHTLFWNSPFRNKIYDLNHDYHSCLRKIDFNRGNPYEWKIDDMEELMNSDCIFARKFSKEHFDVVQEIQKQLSNEK